MLKPFFGTILCQNLKNQGLQIYLLNNLAMVNFSQYFFFKVTFMFC